MWTLHKSFCFFITTALFKVTSSGETLLVAHNHGILLVDVENKTNSSVLSADRPVAAFDVHRGWRQLFWATDSTIYRTPLYDLDTTTELAEVGLVGSLAVDWVHHHLYWSDVSDGGSRVEAAHLDGRRRRVVHRLSSNSRMGAMVLDPLLGKLFWVEWDEGDKNTTRIVTCNLDGSGKKTFLESELIPRDGPLAIDVTYSGLYFHKSTGNSSELWDSNYLVNLQGVRLFDRPGQPPTALCLAKNGFYFSDTNGTHAVKWVKKKYTFVYGDRTDHVVSLDPHFQLVDLGLKKSSEIHVMSEVTQPQWPDQCAFHQCDHECVVTSHRHRNTSCVCRFGYVLKEDGRTCEERGYLIYSLGTTFGKMTPSGKDNTVLYNDSSANFQTFDVDVHSEYIYWSDLSTQAIYRAPIEQMSRKQMVVGDVTAFGLAVDWVYSHVYWSDQSRLLVVSTHGGTPGTPVVVVDGLDSPGNMAVDPIEKYIFWVDCGYKLSIKRAGLDGSNARMLVASDVSCGMSLTADHVTRTLFFLDWAGTVNQILYDGTSRTRFDSDVVRGVAILDHQPLWTVIEYSTPTPDEYDPLFHDQFKVWVNDLQPSMVKVVKRNQQPRVDDECAELECSGVCLPRGDSTPVCACPGNNGNLSPCLKSPKKVKGHSPNDYLSVVEMTPFSVTLQGTGPLLKHNKMRPWVRVDEVGSLVPRDPVVRWSRHVKVVNQSLPFTVDGLNPATTYNFTVQHGVTRGSRTIQLHTPPPPLAVQRLPVVTAPGIQDAVQWLPQGVHYSGVNPWQQLVNREYFLLLLSNTTYTQSDPVLVPQEILAEMRRQIKTSFVVLDSYMTEEEFDDDPTMYLAHLPWGETFQLAMVQATGYKGSYNLDMVYSGTFALPDPYWRPFVDEVLDEQEVIDSIERL